MTEVQCRDKMAGSDGFGGCTVPCIDCHHTCHLSPQESLEVTRKHFLWCGRTEQEAEEAVERERQFLQKIGLMPSDSFRA